MILIQNGPSKSFNQIPEKDKLPKSENSGCNYGVLLKAFPTI